MKTNSKGTLQGAVKNALLRVFKAQGWSREGRSLSLAETLSLGGRKHVHLVRYAGKAYLVGCGADSVQCIVAVDADRTNDEHALVQA